jgi:hypothetical protein
MSRSQPTKYYIGVDVTPPDTTVYEDLHWYEAWLLGYRAKAWPKRDVDLDNERYDIAEKEN